MQKLKLLGGASGKTPQKVNQKELIGINYKSISVFFIASNRVKQCFRVKLGEAIWLIAP